MDAVYPAAASALARGRRRRNATPRLRRRTAPVTFAEIKEVDEENEECEEASRASSASVASAADERRRRPDLLDERLDREFAAFRRRRARRQPLREPDEPPDEAPDEPPEEPPAADAEPAADSGASSGDARAPNEPRAGTAPA